MSVQFYEKVKLNFLKLILMDEHSPFYKRFYKRYVRFLNFREPYEISGFGSNIISGILKTKGSAHVHNLFLLKFCEYFSHCKNRHQQKWVSYFSGISACSMNISFQLNCPRVLEIRDKFSERGIPTDSFDI